MNNENKLDRVIERLLSARPDLTREKIVELINDKKRQVGSKYLTDLGALYLVLNDLGVRLEEDNEYIPVSRISAAFNRASVEGYLLGHKKYEGRTIFYLAYGGRAIRGVYWGQDNPFSSIRPLELLRIKGASIRSGRDGLFEVHLKDSSGIRASGQPQDPLQLSTEDVVELGVYAGCIEGPLRTISYKRKDSSEGKGISFFLRCSFGSFRAVLWEPQDEVHEGYEAVIGPLKHRKTEFGDELVGLDAVYITQKPPKLYIVWKGPEHAIAEDVYGGIRAIRISGSCNGNAILPSSISVEFPWQNVEVSKCLNEEHHGPTLTKLSKLGRGLVNVEFVVLSEPELNGSRYEMLIGDDTAESKLVVPQQHGEKVKGISIGEKVLGLALSASEGSLLVGPYTVLVPQDH